MASLDSVQLKLNETISTLKTDPNCQFIGSREFCALLTSNKAMERSDESSLSIRGVLDVATGVRFLIEEETLLRGCN